MHRENNFFYKAVKKHENNITDLFCNLMKFDYIRHLLLKFFNESERINIPIDIIDYNHINTQKRTENDNKQPDIIIENSNYCCFFEIKIKDSDLQDSQLNEYLSQLESKKVAKNMIYLIPENYKHKVKIEEVKNNKNYADIFYWESFIHFIEHTDLPKGNLIISEFIVFLKNVLEKKDLSLTLNLEEMSLLQNPKDLVVANKLLIKLRDIIDKCALKVTSQLGNIACQKLDEPEAEYGYNFYYGNGDKYLLYFGLWFSLIEDFPNLSDYLLCYGLNTSNDNGDTYFEKKYIENFKKLENYEPAGDWLIKNFEGKYTLAKDDDRIVKDITETLVATINKLMNKSK